MSTEATVAEHYGRSKLEDLIVAALAREGKDLEKLAAADLAAVDEFHAGGLAATEELAKQMELRPGLRVLDVGSGIGGPARYFASEHGCRVTGIDLTEEFVRVAESLTRRTRLDALVDFRQGSALQMPFEGETFDRAYMIHVGMNIADKSSVFREVRRVLKPAGLFAVFDILRTAEGALQFPVPWAVSAQTSFVGTFQEYREVLHEAGFQIVQERGRGAFSIEFSERMIARMKQAGPPALGLHLLMGEKAPVMAGNMLAMMKAGILEPVEMYARAV